MVNHENCLDLRHIFCEKPFHNIYNIYIYIFMHIYIYIYMHKYIYICIYYIHIYIYIYIIFVKNYQILRSNIKLYIKLYYQILIHNFEPVIIS